MIVTAEDKRLWKAVEDGDTLAAGAALRDGADIDIIHANSSAYAINLMVLAERKHDIPMVKFLLENGISRKQSLAVWRCAHSGDVDMLRLLGAYGVDIANIAMSYQAPIHLAAFDGNHEIAKIALDYGASTSELGKGKRGRFQSTPEELVMSGLPFDTRADAVARRKELAAFIRRHAEGQAMPVPQDCTAEALAFEEEGYMAYLDQPRIWHRFAQTIRMAEKKAAEWGNTEEKLHPALLKSILKDVKDSLKPQKDPLVSNARDREEALWLPFRQQVLEDMQSDAPVFCKALLMQKGASGRTWLQRAAECGAFPKVMTFLHARGEQLAAEDLLQEDGTANPLLRAIAEHYALPALFTYANWQGQPARAMQDVYAALPEARREHIGNYTRLGMELRQEETAAKGR